MTAERVAKITQRLQEQFEPTEIAVRDDSKHHVGHAGAASGAGHFHVRIRASAFAGMPTLARHRAIYAAVDSMMGSDIHALSIDAAASE